MIPIRKGDGTGLSVPGYSQVRTGDGRVLFDAAPAIADSGILHEWPVSGTTSPIPDAGGSADISLQNGASFDDTTNNWWDDYAISFDGIDDYGVVSSSRTDPGDSGTLIMSVHFRSFDSSANNYVFTHPDFSNSNDIYFYNTDTGENSIEIADLLLTLDSSPSDGITERWGLRWDSGSAEAFVNGSQVGSGTYSGSISLTTLNWYFGSFDGTKQYGNVIVDYPRLTDERWSDQQMQDDYNAQPWV